MLFTSRTSSAARGLAALFCTAMLALAAPVSASADLYLTALNALRSVDGSSGANGGGIVPMAVPAGGTFACNATWVTVAAKPSGYAIGNCASGTHLRRQSRSAWTDTGYYDGGYVFGTFAGCGWIGVDRLNPAGDLTQTLCPVDSIGYNNAEFMAWSDGCSETNPNPSSCAGTPARNSRTCYLYGNVRPWLSGQVAQNLIRTVPADAQWNGTHRLAWRYVTKYVIGAPWNQQFVMIRDRAVSPGQGNWLFTHHSCFQ